MNYWSPVNVFRSDGNGIQIFLDMHALWFRWIWTWNVQKKNILSLFSFLFFEKTTKVMFSFSSVSHIYKTSRRGEAQIPANTPSFALAHSCRLWEPQVLLWLVCALAPFVSCRMNKTGEGNSCWSRDDVVASVQPTRGQRGRRGLWPHQLSWPSSNL